MNEVRFFKALDENRTVMVSDYEHGDGPEITVGRNKNDIRSMTLDREMLKELAVCIQEYLGDETIPRQ